MCATRSEPGVAAQDRAGQSGRAGGVGGGHRRVAVLLELERARPAVLHRVAQAVQRADAGVAAPREDELARAAHADHLIVDQIGRHAHQREVALALPDDLVPRGEGDEVREALERDGAAVVDVGGDRVVQRQELGHRRGRSRRTRSRPRPAARCRSGTRRRARTRCRRGGRAASAAARRATRWSTGSAAVSRLIVEVDARVQVVEQPAAEHGDGRCAAPAARRRRTGPAPGLIVVEAELAVVLRRDAAEAGEARDRAAGRGCRRDGCSGRGGWPARSRSWRRARRRRRRRGHGPSMRMRLPSVAVETSMSHARVGAQQAVVEERPDRLRGGEREVRHGCRSLDCAALARDDRLAPVNSASAARRSWRRARRARCPSASRAPTPAP